MEQFELIFREHYSSVYAFLLKLSNYHSDIAEELAQETLFRAYLAIGDFKGKCQLRTWLIQIAKNCFYMYLRKNKAQTLSFHEMESDSVAYSASEKSFTDILSEREMLANARVILDGMQPNMRDVMLYRIYSDLPYSQIAILLSISESSAKVLFHRGKNMLRTRLKEEYGYEI